MKLIKIFAGFLSAVFGVAGVAAAALGVHLSFQSINATPVLLEAPEAAEMQIQHMLELMQLMDKIYQHLLNKQYLVLVTMKQQLGVINKKQV